MSDFGKMGTKPSHPELLDWLSAQFVQDGWSVKKLQREILLYKGQVQRLATFLAGDIPVAAAKLDKMTDTLQAYTNLAVTNSGAANMMNLPAESKATSEAPPPHAAGDEKVH